MAAAADDGDGSHAIKNNESAYRRFISLRNPAINNLAESILRQPKTPSLVGYEKSLPVLFPIKASGMWRNTSLMILLFSTFQP